MPLNQITANPAENVVKAAAIIATLKKAEDANRDVLHLLQYHFATTLCDNVPAKIRENPSMAFPYVQCALRVAAAMPGTWEILVGALQDRSPYLVPLIPEKVANETDVAYRKRLGSVDAKFAELHRGYAILYAALCVSQVECPDNASYRQRMPRIGDLWTLLSKCVNRQPMFLTAPLVSALLQTGAEDLLCVYGRQMSKLLRYIHRVYVPLCYRVAQDDRDKDEARGLEMVVEKGAHNNYTSVHLSEFLSPSVFVQVKRNFQFKPTGPPPPPSNDGNNQ